MNRAVASVVVAAHEEAATIGRCLDALLRFAEPGELEVVVVCNGCTDGTADEARRAAPHATVAELPEASKVAALRRGDELATAFPRIYLDADVVLDTDAARQLVAALHRPGVIAAAPTRRLDVTRSSWPVRAYLRIWSRLPAVEGSIAGRGVYALSREGRERFGRFPDVVADDRFVDRLAAPHERVFVGGAAVVTAPRDVRSQIRRMTRVIVGNREGSGPSTDRTAWLGVVRRDPRLLGDVLPYLTLTVSAKVRASVLQRTGGAGWQRDVSSRA